MVEAGAGDYYVEGDLAPSRGSKFWVWLQHFFKRRKTAYLSCAALTALLGWWSENYAAWAFFVVIYALVLKIMAMFDKSGHLIIVECRLQGEVIRHCSRFRKPIFVPTSGIRIWSVPDSRKQDLLLYGDKNPPVHTANILVCDYFEELPTHEIVVVCPRDANFSNFALFARMNPDLARALKELGNLRMANDELREMAVAKYQEELKAGSDPVEAKRRLDAALLNLRRFEERLSVTDAAQRNLWLYYKEKIPELTKLVVMVKQDIYRLATVEAAKLLHQALQYPMSPEIVDKMERMVAEPNLADYEDRLARPRANAERSETNLNPSSHLEGDAFRVPAEG